MMAEDWCEDTGGAEFRYIADGEFALGINGIGQAHAVSTEHDEVFLGCLLCHFEVE